MDQARFDRITRTLASGQSRRGLLKGLTGSALGGVLAAVGLRGTALAAPAGKTTICHWDATLATYQQLSVTAKDLKGHARHTQDILAPDFASTQTCGSCNATCTTTVAHATATCSAGTCGFTCSSGYRSDGNGGCTLNCDPATCIVPANSTANCTSGRCGFTCNSGYASDGNGGCAAFNGVRTICYCDTGNFFQCMPYDENGTLTPEGEACYATCGAEHYSGIGYTDDYNVLNCVQGQ